LFQRRREFDDGAIMELKIWQVPEPVPPTSHGFKYSLFYGNSGKRLVGYDNERGKGDHKHLSDGEIQYAFTTVERLIQDFLDDVSFARGTS
jgi:Family of unknown function (DUF6516)